MAATKIPRRRTPRNFQSGSSTYNLFTSTLLKELLKKVSEIPASLDYDAFGRIYEYFLGEFAMSEGQGGGEFYTPSSIVRLLTEVIEPYHGRILDPACGSGGMENCELRSPSCEVQSIRHSSFVIRDFLRLSIHGVEKTDETGRLCRLHLAVHGLEGEIKHGGGEKCEVRMTNGVSMSEELKKRTKKFALDVIKFCSGLPQTLETRHAIGQIIRPSSSKAANYRSACRAKSKADFISKLGTVEEEADESGFWLEILRDILQLRAPNDDFRMSSRAVKPEVRQSQLDIRTLQELDRLEDEADQLVAITVASKKTARGDHGPKSD